LGSVQSYWLQQFAALQAYKKREGHCNVPEDYEKDSELGMWIHNQRAYCRRGKLPPERFAKLIALGFDWDPYETSWQQMFGELKAFKTREGHCNVPARYKRNPQLGAWVYAQGGLFRKGALPASKLYELRSIGFEWEPFETMWQSMFEKLQAFQRREGHCRVPFRRAESSELAHWVSTQRQFYRKGKLSKGRIQKLEAIGFKWEPASDGWQQMFEELKAFKQKEGHCSVPRKSRALKLAAWVLNQRRLFGKGKLSKVRIRQLEEIGFEWDPFENAWHQLFGELVAFKRREGHCAVPANSARNAPLARWAKKQQQIYSKGKLSAERVKKLESVGFEWKRQRRHERA